MGVKNKIGLFFGIFLFFVSLYMFAGVNNAVVTDSRAVIQSEIENTQMYGQLYLRFDGANVKNAPKILINGECVCTVSEKEKTLDIFDMCVVELDTRGLDAPVMLSIDGKSANVITDCVGRVVTGYGGIENVGTFIIENAQKGYGE